VFDQASFSLDAFDQDSWLFLFETGYADLSHRQRVYVTSVVESIYAQSVADQIISVAAQNNLSVLDAIQAITAKSSVETLVVRKERKVSAAPQARERVAKIERPVATGPVYSVANSETTHAFATSETGYAFSTPEEIVSTFQQTSLFIQHKPRRSSLEQS
jgi:hypothetical protein